MKKILIGFAVIALLVGGSTLFRVPEFGESLEKLQQDATQFAAKAQPAETTAKEKADEAFKAPSPKTHQAAAEKLGDLVRLYDDQISVLEGDLRVVEASGQATFERVARRIEQLQDETLKAAQTQRLQNERRRFSRSLEMLRARISDCRAAMVSAKDLQLVAQNDQDLQKLGALHQNITELSTRSQTLIASIRSLRTQDLLAMGS